MNSTRIKNSHTGQVGWRFRYRNPLTKRRTNITIWIQDQSKATRAFLNHLDNLNCRLHGLPDNSYLWRPWPDLLKKFLAEAPLASEERRHHLTRFLGRNQLGLRLGADLTIGNLNLQLRKVTGMSNQAKVQLQGALKQLTRCLAELGVMQINPLAPWRKLKLEIVRRHRRAYTPSMVVAILAAAREFDQYCRRECPVEIALKMLLFTGNRPGAIFKTTVGDIDWETERLILQPGNGHKRNGRCYLPKGFIPELRTYLIQRKQPNINAPLLISPKGGAIDPANFSKDFRQILVLVFVKKHWPEGELLTSGLRPIDVAHAIAFGRPRGFDGAPPTDPVKIEARRQHASRVALLAGQLRPQVEKELEGCDLYALRATHISWARRLTNPDSVRSQVGHAPQDIEEKHYLDLEMVNGRESAEAVWDVFTGRRSLEAGREQELQIMITENK